MAATAAPHSPPADYLAGDAEKGDLSPSTSAPSSITNAGGDALVSEKSRGVRQMEALQTRLSTKYRILLYGSFAVLAYVMSLDQYTNSSYLTAATSVSFNAHSTLTTISSIKSVFQAVSQPPVAKIADGAGRIEAYALCVFFYVIGYIVVASAQSVYAYAAGNSIYVIGITGLFLLQNIIIADISSTRNRLFWSIFPSIPGTINVWVSGNIAQSLLGSRNQHANMWRWGIGMWCIIVPICATPILLTLGIGMRKTKAQHIEDRTEQRIAKQPLKKRALAIFWQLDIIGLLLLVAGFGMLLTIVTIANGKGSHWSDPHSIALLTCGGFFVICFILWERFGARHPLIPFSLLKNRTVIACFVIAIVHPAAGGVIGSYFYTYVLVAANETTLSAKRITSLASFTSTLTAAVMGIAVRYIRYLKVIIIFGFCIEVLAFGLMIRYRGAGATAGDLAAVQVVRGIAVGSISFPVQAAIQSVTKREYLTLFYLSQGVGSAIGGGIWSNLVPGKMREYISDPAIAAKAYSNPISLISKYAPGTEVRDAMARAQGETQHVLSITGTCLAAVGLCTAMFIQWLKLTDEQSLAQVEEAEVGKLKETATDKVEGK
ncbi:putative siderochrome-iron transporter [Rhodotorula sp. JG-1b]|nr:putative siderochrome-iron transporter [Rhodotorula sp. JG-1b]